MLTQMENYKTRESKTSRKSLLVCTEHLEGSEAQTGVSTGSTSPGVRTGLATCDISSDTHTAPHSSARWQTWGQPCAPSPVWEDSSLPTAPPPQGLPAQPSHSFLIIHGIMTKKHTFPHSNLHKLIVYVINKETVLAEASCLTLKFDKPPFSYFMNLSKWKL